MPDREDALKDDFQFGSGGDGEWDDQDEGWVEEEEAPLEDTDPSIKDENTAYIEFLSEEAQKIERLCQQAEPVDELGEESLLLESALDKIEPYQLFKTTIGRTSALYLTAVLCACVRVCAFLTRPGLQQAEPQYYQSLLSHLSQDERETIETVFQQAELEAVNAQSHLKAVAAAAAAALAVQNGGMAVGPPGTQSLNPPS